MTGAPQPSIAFFMHDLSGGGVERMRLRLAAAFAARGHAVTIIVQSARGALCADFPPNVSLIDLRRPHTWSAVVPLARVLRARRPSILISSLDHNNIAALCARVLAGRATKIIICQHNALSSESASGWRYRVVPLFYRALARWADGIVAVSEGVAADLATVTGLPRARVTVIHNPAVIDADETTLTPPHAWLADRTLPVFVFVGRLVAQKDPGLLLRAFALRLKGGAARLIFCGEGPLLGDLRRQACLLGIDHAVHFAGFVAEPRAWMIHAAALVLPSRYEGFGNVIVEALSCGTPVIATNCPHGPAEILAGGRFGWLVPVGDEVSMAEAMEDHPRESFPAAKLVRRAQGFSLLGCVTGHQVLLDRILAHWMRPVFGLVFSRLDATEICERMLSDDAPTEVRAVVSQNVDTVRLLRTRPEYVEASRAAAIICPDGFPVAAYGLLRGSGSGARVTGCAVFHALAREAPTRGRRILVIAESEETAAELLVWGAERSCAQYWQAIVAPPDLLSDPDGQRDLVRGIAGARPDILVMTLGAPGSEIFLHRHHIALPPCWALCCGQAVRVELGLERRAPAMWQSLNLEWAWRLLREPGRLAPRYVQGLISFPMDVIADLRNSKEGKKEAVLFSKKEPKNSCSNG